ncbi:MAG: ATP-binding protein [Xanthomonadales bacterium]|jgi:signal transduction histidine kinase|nr:ATP-binding protein [Xanthomonadales bacterium]
MSTASEHRASPGLSEAVAAEAVRLQYQGMPIAFLASGGMAVVVAAIFQESMPPAIWGTWLVAVLAHVLGRALLRRRFEQLRPSITELPRWGRYAVVGTTASGILWGAGTVLGLLYSTPAMELLLVPLILLLTIAAVISAISYIAVYYAFVIPATVPGVVMLLLEPDTLHLMTGTAYLFFLIMMSRFAHVLHRSFMTSIRLRFENADLIGALRREKNAAIDANLAKSRFLAAASHDLRQPVHALRLFIESFPVQGLRPEQSETLAQIRQSADSMGLLFDALMDMSRLDAGVVEPVIECFEIASFATRLHREFRPQADARGLELRLRTRSATVRTDPILLNRIVSNLLSNAIRHGARPGVLLALRPRQGHIAIEVWDTGNGIPEPLQRMVFEEFFQIGNPERDREKGLGLGLAIVDRLVRLLGLTLQLRSRSGVGSMFRVLVPTSAREISPSPPTESPQRAPRWAPRAELQVVVIDDERSVREATAALLSSWGCRVRSAAAVEELMVDGSAVPDLIIADLRLRGDCTGLIAIDQLRRHHARTIPAVVVTGDTSPERLSLLRDSGLPVLHKPLKLDQLRELLDRVPAASR